MENGWYVYILQCGDGTLYTGIAKDVAQRLQMHSSGEGAKYTRGRGPLKLCYQESAESHSQALRREYAIKRLSRAEKLALIEQYTPGDD